MAFHEPLYGRGAHYFYTPTAGGKLIARDRRRSACIGASGRRAYRGYSPQARGRSERVFHTLQDRLVKELALKEIDTVEAANCSVRCLYPEYNARFAVAAAQEGTAFWRSCVDLAEILCVQEERQVATKLRCRSTGSSATYRKARCAPISSDAREVRHIQMEPMRFSTGRDAWNAYDKRAFSMKERKAA